MLVLENQTVLSKAEREACIASQSALPFKHVRSHLEVVGVGHIMFKSHGGKVVTRFECELEGEREEVPLSIIGDLVGEEPRVLVEGRLRGQRLAISMQQGGIRLGKKASQCFKVNRVLSNVKDAMPKSTEGTEGMDGGISIFVSGGQEDGAKRPLLRVGATRLRASASLD